MDEAVRQTPVDKGLERTKLFGWEKSGKESLKIFEGVLSL